MLSYRHPTIEDVPRLNAWIAQDPDHREKCNGEFFVLLPDEKGEIPKGIQCIEVKDEEGTVFFLKFTNAVIVDTQFAPESIVSKERVRAALAEAFQFSASSLKVNGAHAMMFESVSEGLIKFFSRFGFKPLTNFFKVDL